MLLNSYQKRIFRAECNPNFESLHCIAQLDQDVSGALPYIKREGGRKYLLDIRDLDAFNDSQKASYAV